MIALFADPAVLACASGVVGLMVGSFLNVVIHRLPIMMERDWAAQCAELKSEPPPVFEPLSLARPRSRCPQCGHAITALENIPLLSWLLLHGRCKGCAAPISVRYPLIEALTGLRWEVIAARLDPTGSFWKLQARRAPDDDWGDLKPSSFAEDWGALAPATNFEDWGP